ncbi:MAG TPA: hypothetical protein VFT50_04170 [Baekduia sp.]|nr:hypothetical protein [Baekduia sp.]
MSPTLRTVPIVLAAASLMAPAAANAAKRHHRFKPAYPKVGKIAPRKVAIGDTLTIKGRNLRVGKLTTTVVFQRKGKPAVFVKASGGTKRRLVLRVPEKLAAFLAIRDGDAKQTQFRMRVLTTRFAKRWTSPARSPLVSPKVVEDPASPVAPPATGPGSTPAPQPTPYELCQAAAKANPAGDEDHDGLSNGTELALVDKTDPCAADTDGDGMVDGYEYLSAVDLNGSAVPYPGKRPWPNPLDGADGGYDFDGDGLTLSQEYMLWKFAGGTFPLTAYSDGTQNSGGTHAATLAETALDLDGDGNLTDDERDADGDGLSNEVELNLTGLQTWWDKAYKDEKPYTIAKFVQPSATDEDTDGDGIADGLDDQDHDGWDNVAEMQDPGRASGYRIQPYNPCLPDPYARTCSRYATFDDPWPPFDDSQHPGDAVPFQFPNATAVAPDPGWNGNTGPQGS